MAKRTLETTRTHDGRTLVTDTRAQAEQWPGRILTVDLGGRGLVVGAGDNLEDLSGSLAECVQQLLDAPADNQPPALAYDVTVTLRSGHRIEVPRWEGYQPDTILDRLARGAGVIALYTNAPAQNVVRVEEIAAVHAEPSTGIQAVQLEDGTYIWGCLGCGLVGGDPAELPNIVVMTGTFTHRCPGADRA